jgi:hypothetical protein
MRTKGHQKRLQHIIYQYISRSLFKADRLMFALHLVNKMYSQQINEKVSTTYILVICGLFTNHTGTVNEGCGAWKTMQEYVNFQARFNHTRLFFYNFCGVDSCLPSISTFWNLRQLQLNSVITTLVCAIPHL